MRQERLLWGRGISALGDGLWFTIWVLYFTRVLSLTPTTVGIGMAVAGGAGMAAAVPLGALSDRFDPRGVLVVLTVIRAAAMAGYLLVGDMWGFLGVTVVFVALANGGTAVHTALVTALLPDRDGRVRTLARQRVAQHVGFAIGAGLGALVLAADQVAVYRLAIGGNALSFLVLAALVTGVGPAVRPPSTPRGRRGGSGRAVLRDRPYCAVVAATALLSLCWAMLSTGLPLWISGFTALPLPLSGAVVVISSVGIAALQVPATRLARNTGQAARIATWSGLALAASCVLLAGTAQRGDLLAAGLVVAAALLHVTGELGYVAAGWALSVDLMREEARGAYQGVAEAATATVQMVAPGLFTLVLTTLGAGGWLLVAALFLAGGSAVPVATRWAQRTRPRPAVAGRPPAVEV